MNLLLLLPRRQFTTCCGRQWEGHASDPRSLPRRDFFKLAAAGTVGLATLVTLKRRAAAGAGRCSRCTCPDYVRVLYSDLCQRCGHSYSDHW
jgi:hypothetical protein